MIEPVIDAFTSGYICGPCHIANKAMINSAALPNVALSNPPTPEPSVAARFSVARPIKPANGTIAVAEAPKIHKSSAPANRSPSATGKATSNTSSGCSARYRQRVFIRESGVSVGMRREGSVLAVVCRSS